MIRPVAAPYFEKARRSFEIIIVDKKVTATLGGAEGVAALLDALDKGAAKIMENGGGSASVA